MFIHQREEIPTDSPIGRLERKVAPLECYSPKGNRRFVSFTAIPSRFHPDQRSSASPHANNGENYSLLPPIITPFICRLQPGQSGATSPTIFLRGRKSPDVDWKTKMMCRRNSEAHSMRKLKLCRYGRQLTANAVSLCVLPFSAYPQI
ncbi:hypothetical protein Acr_06g0017270 [Actinidia rufa]|uniref:Uncharacterized protein n=1 Tax=Actinidia rufa TaxID=165716 RepID=A0A7J0EW03_9ERIC|nr:hypothetical protein Acr_06g0017270 [Actinidia rufa]